MKKYSANLVRFSATWLTLALILTISTPSHAQTSWRTVYDRNQLLDYGVQRPADLLDILPNWNSWSVDGFSNHVSANGLSNYTHERWALFVDNRRIERSLLGLLDLNLLPITVQQIDSVEVFSMSTTIAGQWVGHGAIHFHIKRDQDGIDLGGSMYTGNEINDPGPFLYTEYRTQNIDRVGPDGNGYLHVASKGFYASASALYREHHSTDEHIGYRTRVRHDNNNHSPRKMLFAPLVRLGYAGERSDVEAVITQSAFNDFAYIPGFGAELPMRQTYTSLSARGSFVMGENLTFSAGVSATEDFNHGRDNLLAWDPNIKADAVRARAGFTVTSAAWSLAFGGGADLFRARPFNDVLISDQYRIYHGYFNADRTTPDAQTHIASEIAQVAGSFLPKIYAHYRRHPMSLHASYSRNSIFEQQSLWYWMSMGYQGFNMLTPNPTGFDNIGVNSQATADIELALFTSPTSDLKAHGGIRHTSGDWSTVSEYTYLPDQVRFEDDLRLVPDLGGMLAVAGIGGRLRTGRGFEQEVYGGVQSAVTGGDTYREIGREVPKLRAFYGLRYIGVPGFAMAGRLDVQSATEWSAFFNTSRDETPYYDGPVVPTHVKLNLFVRKTILSERAWAALKFENVLNRSLQEWPAGEVRDMTFHISVGASLKGNSSSRYSDDPFKRPVY